MSRLRGFTLIEAMLATVVVGFIGAASLTLASVAAREHQRGRLRTVIAADAQAVIERVVAIASTARNYGGTDAFCASIMSDEGPFAHGTASGACPYLSITDVPVYGLNARRSATLVATTYEGLAGIELTLEVSSPGLDQAYTVQTFLRAVP